ncbi:MAG TPA: malto-oligosyltrehalose trehalohydrolase [Gemmatimonadaceae bacterium]|nr:malto-oligosyltrehalose trehalohydrolase [Gemmatimonadaceae bacterium]
MTAQHTRRLPVGAEIAEAGVHFRVWAPRRKTVQIVAGDREQQLAAERDGYFAGVMPGVGAGLRYKVRLDSGDAYPDPASRYQPDGPHAESLVVDPAQFRWSDSAWRGLRPTGQIFYELHIGTFTPEGTFSAAAKQLRELRDLGITTVEVMPVAEFPGRFGWGYDGVDLFAPYHGYGTPDDFRAFVDRAHSEGLGVILDVVFNHFGPDGNYLGEFSEAYISQKHKTEWGGALNFDGEHSRPVREFILANVTHWIAEYHLDGLRLDATHAIYDNSDRHILRDIGDAARTAGGERDVLIVAENEPQDPRVVRPVEQGGYGLDQVWCDDFHHSATVAAGGKREAYFTDYRGSAQELVSAMKYGVLYQGQHYVWQKKRRGSAAWDLAPHHMVFYLENHDQVANTRDGRRLAQLTSPGRYRALSAVLLLARQTPLLFQGQEFGASAPFLYFADHNPELAQLVRKGRAEFLGQFPSIGDSEGHLSLDDPANPQTFERSRLDLTERERHAAHYTLYRDLIALRRCDPVLASADAPRMDGAVLADHAFAIRYFANDGNDRLLVVNLGRDVVLDVAPEPLLGPPDPDRGWQRLWHSEDAVYGGRGAPPIESKDGTWQIPAESATLLAHDAD